MSTLWMMQRKKCCYCEAYIPEDGHLKAVEHVKPQSVYPNLMNDWSNLLLACAQCNGKKSDKFPMGLADGTKVIRGRGRPLLIDPSVVDPEDHLDFVVDVNELEILGLIQPKNDSKRGAATIQTTGLADQFHTNRHRRVIRDLLFDFLSMDRASAQGDQQQLEQYKEKFRGTLSAGNECAAVARTFAKKYRLRERFEIEIPVGWNTV